MKTNWPHPIWIVLSTFGLIAITLFGLSIFATGYLLTSISRMTTSSSSDGKFFSSMKIDGDSVAGIRLEGEIGAKMVEDVLEKFDQASQQSNIKGILLEVNSPGGAVVPSQEIYDAVVRIKEKMPVVVYVRDMAASGAYYASASASSIVANRGSLVGSIGVILSTVEGTKLLEWMKLKPITLKTGKLKDSGSPFREWNQDDKEYLQKLIEATRVQFMSDVQKGRNLDAASVGYMSDGRVVLADEGLNLKLVDKLGDKDVALQEIQALAGLKKKPHLFYLEKKKGLEELTEELLRGKEVKLGNVLKEAFLPESGLRAK